MYTEVFKAGKFISEQLANTVIKGKQAVVKYQVLNNLQMNILG